MKLSVLLSIYAFFALFTCAAFLVTPAFWITLYGANADPQAMLLYRLLGSLFGGFGAMAWLGRNAEPSQTRDAIVLGLTVSNGLVAVIAVWAAISGVYNQFAWGPAVTCGLLAIGFLLIGRSGARAGVRSQA